MTIRRTLAAALAAAALAAPAASAQPADTPARPIHSTPAPFSGPVSPGHPSEAANVRPLAPASDEPPASHGDDVDWATLGLGIAGLVLFTGGVVGLATRTRPAAGRRVSV